MLDHTNVVLNVNNDSTSTLATGTFHQRVCVVWHRISLRTYTKCLPSHQSPRSHDLKGPTSDRQSLHARWSSFTSDAYKVPLSYLQLDRFPTLENRLKHSAVNLDLNVSLSLLGMIDFQALP